MPESAASASESRETRLRFCGWCREQLPSYSRLDAKYCCDRCRHYARVDRGNTGKVYRTKVLKSGMVSVVIHVKKSTLTAGDEIKWGKVI